MVMVHRVGKSTYGGSLSIGLGRGHKIAKDHNKIMGGSGLSHKIYEGGSLIKKSEVLRNLKLSKPSIPKKYISLEL
jgi:hypothetical protein